MFQSYLSGYASHLPTKIMTNHDLEKILDTSDEWIYKRTGIRQRHIAAEGEFTSDLATKAAEKALEKANLSASDIDLIIVATTTPDLTFPSTATIVQSKLNATNAFAFDVQAVCSGFLYALSTAHRFIQTGTVRHALVIGAETMSRILDWQDRSTAVLFGDGAGSFVLSRQEDSSSHSRLIDVDLYSNGHKKDILYTTGGPSSSDIVGTLKMDGRSVFIEAIDKMNRSLLHILEKHNISVDQVAKIIPHQANERIMAAIAEKLNQPFDKFVSTVGSQANTSAATLPLAFTHAMDNNMIKSGDIVGFCVAGAGFTWGSALLVL